MTFGRNQLFRSLSFDFRIEGYKLLVTSREAFKTFESTYSLTTLSEKNAMALFKNIAFPQGGRDEYEKPGEALLDTVLYPSPIYIYACIQN